VAFGKRSPFVHSQNRPTGSLPCNISKTLEHRASEPSFQPARLPRESSDRPIRVLRRSRRLWPTRRRWPASGPGFGQRGLCFMEPQPVGDNGVVTPLDQCDQPRLQRHALLACEVRCVAGFRRRGSHGYARSNKTGLSRGTPAMGTPSYLHGCGAPGPAKSWSVTRS
jgi:hypothetical protein